MKNFVLTTLTALAMFATPVFAADATSGTVSWNQGPSSGWTWSYAPVLGYPAGGNSGTLGLANGAASGATVTLANPSATTAYEYDLPTTAGTSGQVLLSAGGAGTAMTWGSVSGTGNFAKTASPTFTGTITAAALTTSGALTASGGVDGILGGVTPAAVTATTGVFSSTLSTTALTATATTNQLILGTTRTLTLTAPTPASSSRTVTLPDPGGSDTVVYNALAATLTNKTLTSPVITGPVPVACGSTCTLGTANLGGYTRLDTAGGSAATLPSATGTGNTYKLYISVATTSAQDKVLLTTVTDTIIGTAQGENAATAKVFVGNAGTYHSIQMPFAGSQPSGGFIGDTISCTDVASTIWKCDIVYQAGTTPTTPYNTGTT